MTCSLGPLAGRPTASDRVYEAADHRVGGEHAVQVGADRAADLVALEGCQAMFSNARSRMSRSARWSASGSRLKASGAADMLARTRP